MYKFTAQKSERSSSPDVKISVLIMSGIETASVSISMCRLKPCLIAMTGCGAGGCTKGAKNVVEDVRLVSGQVDYWKPNDYRQPWQDEP